MPVFGGCWISSEQHKTERQPPGGLWREVTANGFGKTPVGAKAQPARFGGHSRLVLVCSGLQSCCEQPAGGGAFISL